MRSTHEVSQCRYQYDPLDRLGVCTLFEQPSTRRFYLKDRLVCEIEGAVQRSIFQYEGLLLAQCSPHTGAFGTNLLATDQKRSVFNLLDAERALSYLIYTPYGYDTLESVSRGMLAFNGERVDQITGGYLLGNGCRAFNPILMRFNSPDSFSPFGRGGMNSYAYCLGDPVNREDSSGHIPNFLKPLLRSLHLIKKSKPVSVKVPLPQSTHHVDPGTQRVFSAQTSVAPIAKLEPASRSVGQITNALTPGGVKNNVGPEFIRKLESYSGRIEMVPVNKEAMNYIKYYARQYPQISAPEASSLIRGVAKLDTLPEGSYYMFPNMPGRT
ncbi:RHS repeat-associated core domain-containing protein [Pseudomonas moorei]|uniref:RHS repeat-associated core domain-containing protein n=1 Tax=Pseudomonas moorei TaxID=395599 RepID=UPI00200F88CC|nr:RHS repeat-associated core domain-containing protein [Pseudomonas moorei]